MASDIANEMMSAKQQRPFTSRMVDALLPSLLSAVASALIVGWVSLKVMEVKLEDIQKKSDANAISIEALKVNFATVSIASNEYVKRLDASLVAQNEISRKIDDRLTYLEREWFRRRQGS